MTCTGRLLPEGPVPGPAADGEEHRGADDLPARTSATSPTWLSPAAYSWQSRSIARVQLAELVALGRRRAPPAAEYATEAAGPDDQRVVERLQWGGHHYIGLVVGEREILQADRLSVGVARWKPT